MSQDASAFFLLILLSFLGLDSVVGIFLQMNIFQDGSMGLTLGRFLMIY